MPSAANSTPSPAGGMLDGALGVVAALEVLRRAKESNLELNWPIELVATSEEV